VRKLHKPFSQKVFAKNKVAMEKVFKKSKSSFHAMGFSPQLMTQPKASHYGLQSVVDEITKAVHATGFNP